MSLIKTLSYINVWPDALFIHRRDYLFAREDHCSELKFRDKSVSLTNHSSRRHRVSRAVLSLLTSLVVTATPALSQTQNKVIEWSKSPIGSNNERVAANLKLFRQIEGLEIEDFTVDGNSITVNEPFAAAEDWLESITIRVRNISDQPLVSVQITLVLPEMGGSPDIVFCYGCSAVEKKKGFMPGETVELRMLGGGFYEWIRSRITEKGSISRITKAEISHVYATPPAGPTWYSGCVKTTNPRNACPRSGA